MVVTPAGNSVPRYLLDAYVDALKEALLMKRRRYRPEIRQTPKYDNLWTRAALILIDNKCDPFRFINFAFDMFIDKHDDVYPTMVVSDYCMARFIEENPKYEHQLKLRVKLQAEYVKHRLDSGETLDEILLDEDSSLSSLFKFALAYSEKRQDLAERFRAAAVELLFFEPLYKTILGSWLPKELCDG
jgi:hypothetical protein